MFRLDLNNLMRVMAGASQYLAQLLSARMKVSQRQLQQYTHQAFGRSAQEWLDELRLITAAEMLKTESPVKLVCFELGFKQVSHFSRVFKVRYGVTPTAVVERNDGQPADAQSLPAL